MDFWVLKRVLATRWKTFDRLISIEFLDSDDCDRLADSASITVSNNQSKTRIDIVD